MIKLTRSEALKESYRTGRRKSWNKGKKMDYGWKISDALKGKVPKNLALINANKKGSGNPMWGKHTSEKQKATVRARKGELNQNWKGDDVGYDALHDWLKRWHGVANKCENIKCESLYKEKVRKVSPFAWANITGEYKRGIENWKQLCIFCHNRFDKGIIELYF